MDNDWEVEWLLYDLCYAVTEEERNEILDKIEELKKLKYNKNEIKTQEAEYRWAKNYYTNSSYYSPDYLDDDNIVEFLPPGYLIQNPSMEQENRKKSDRERKRRSRKKSNID